MAPLVFNGTTIPTNVANALKYNGTSVTKVIYNGTTVWQQSLCTVCSGWTGSSTVSIWQGGGIQAGINTSGFNCRVEANGYGAWILYSDSSSSFSGVTSTAMATNIYSSGSNLKFGNTSNSWVTYTKASKTWSGSGGGYVTDDYSGYIDYVGFVTSGGLLAMKGWTNYNGSVRYGTWINLV